MQTCKLRSRGSREGGRRQVGQDSELFVALAIFNASFNTAEETAAYHSLLRGTRLWLCGACAARGWQLFLTTARICAGTEEYPAQSDCHLCPAHPNPSIQACQQEDMMEESLPTTLRLWSATWFARAKGALVRQTLLHK